MHRSLNHNQRSLLPVIEASPPKIQRLTHQSRKEKNRKEKVAPPNLEGAEAANETNPKNTTHHRESRMQTPTERTRCKIPPRSRTLARDQGAVPRQEIKLDPDEKHTAERKVRTPPKEQKVSSRREAGHKTLPKDQGVGRPH